MNYVQPQGAPAPMPQQMQQPQQGYVAQQAYAPQGVPAPQQVQQSQGSINFYGTNLNPQDAQVINQMYGAACQTLGLQLSDQATIAKSLFFGARDLFKTIYVNQISSQRGESPKTPDYEQAQTCFEQTFGSVGKLKVSELQLCCVMKAVAPSLLPDLVNGSEPHALIKEYILEHNWMSQNVRQNSSGISRSSGNGNGNTYANPFDGGAQSKAAAAAGFVPQQQSVGFVPQQVTSYTQPQQVAQAVMQTMPGYGG
jgi:hypothetical protein